LTRKIGIDEVNNLVDNKDGYVANCCQDEDIEG
jgi:hypothetical protein